MKETGTLKNLDMMMLPPTAHTLLLGNDFLLADNFGLPLDPVALDQFVSSRHPFKINFTLLLFCRQGHMRVRWNLKKIRLGSDDVLVILPNTIGECLHFSPDCQVAIIAFPGNRYAETVDSAYVVAFRKYLARQPLFHVSPEEFQELLDIYRAMWRKMHRPDFRFTREVLGGYMQVLIANGCQWMSRRLENTAAASVPTRQQMQFDRFLELLQLHHRHHHDIAFYAGQMCLTPKYLSAIVHRVSGRHAGDWIRDIVILEAKALLKTRRHTVQQISDLLNFPNPSFFGKYFKSAVGLTPRRYMLS